MSGLTFQRAFMGYIGHKTSKNHAAWKQQLFLSTDMVKAFSWVFSLVHQNPWRLFQPLPKYVKVIKTDASPSGGAWGTEHGIAYWPWPSLLESKHMFLAEILTMIFALMINGSMFTHTQFFLVGDALGALQDLQSFKAPVEYPELNFLLFHLWELFELNHNSMLQFHVPSLQNWMDPMSRVFEQGF